MLQDEGRGGGGGGQTNLTMGLQHHADFGVGSAHNGTLKEAVGWSSKEALGLVSTAAADGLRGVAGSELDGAREVGASAVLDHGRRIGPRHGRGLCVMGVRVQEEVSCVCREEEKVGEQSIFEFPKLIKAVTK